MIRKYRIYRRFLSVCEFFKTFLVEVSEANTCKGAFNCSS